MSILDFIEEFERKITRLKAVNCDIPNAILAHTLVKNAGLSEEAKGIVKASATDLSYSAVKENMMKIYSKSFGKKREDLPTVKEECMYNNSGFRDNSGFRGRGNNRYRSRGRGNNYGGGNYRPRYKNTIDQSTQKPKLCFNCGSDEHIVKFCNKPRVGDKRKRTNYPTYYNEEGNKEEEEQEANVNINLMSLADDL